MQVEEMAVDALIPFVRNNLKHPDTQIDRIANSIKEYGFTVPILCGKDNVIIAGHGRLLAAKKLGMETVPVLRKEDLTPSQERQYRILDNSLTRQSEWDFENLLVEFDFLKEGGFDFGAWGLDTLIPQAEPIVEVHEDDYEPPPVDEISTFIKRGDLIELGRHRVLCGDSTVAEDVAYLMGDVKAPLLHADPPYGMGKENDGIANDNIYGSELDKFQMSWWRVFRPYLDNNASAYIWGNAESLWRLWYIGGLQKSERLTFRNELVWDKQHGQGMESEQHRMYPTATERCLFFMLGEQGFNNNADNYWEGWDSILNYLREQKAKAGWTADDIHRILGSASNGGGLASHYFGRSQWLLPTKEHYEKLQAAAKGDAFKKDYDAFKKDYDELKKEFYSTRAYFDNTHENMTDVWEYPRVKGEERWEHATPKPVQLIARLLKSSCPEGGSIIEPFLGSGSTLIAGEQTDRTVFGMEIEPRYCQVIIDRYKKYCDTNNKEFICKINGEPYEPSATV